jgi:hypothetical protein
MKLKINNVHGYSGEVTVKCDRNGIPLERFWRNRLRDAKTDNCVEVVTAKKIKVKEQVK